MCIAPEAESFRKGIGPENSIPLHLCNKRKNLLRGIYSSFKSWLASILMYYNLYYIYKNHLDKKAAISSLPAHPSP